MTTLSLRRRWPVLIGFLAFLFAMAVPAAASADTVRIWDPTAGRYVEYRPSFAEKPERPRPTYRYFDADRGVWSTYRASREEMAAAHREKFRRRVVAFRTSEPAGTVIVDTPARYLYYVLGDGRAIRYGIGVGREGFTWAGRERVTRKAEWPDWRPPADMLRREPHLPRFVPGGPQNPLGARALYLGSTLYRIHGTNQDWSIGYAVSSGCIRMMNEDVVDLYRRVGIGTEVIVLGPESDRSIVTAALAAAES